MAACHMSAWLRVAYSYDVKYLSPSRSKYYYFLNLTFFYHLLKFYSCACLLMALSLFPTQWYNITIHPYLNHKEQVKMDIYTKHEKEKKYHKHYQISCIVSMLFVLFDLFFFCLLFPPLIDVSTIFKDLIVVGRVMNNIDIRAIIKLSVEVNSLAVSICSFSFFLYCTPTSSTDFFVCCTFALSRSVYQEF